jgi:hypothetical protein
MLSIHFENSRAIEQLSSGTAGPIWMNLPSNYIWMAMPQEQHADTYFGHHINK